MAREKSINEKWRDWRLDSAFVNEKKGDDKIQVPGIGMYTYDTLKSKVQRMAKDLSDNPVLSLFCMAEKARVAAISVRISFLNTPSVPKNSEPLTSTISIRVSSLSSSKTLTKGSLYRAVTFQSMLRMSSPYWYCRTSLKVIPRPLKAEWYSPPKM